MNIEEIHSKVLTAIETAKIKLNGNMQDLVGQVIIKHGATEDGFFIETDTYLFIGYDRHECDRSSAWPLEDKSRVTASLLDDIEYITYEEYLGYLRHERELSEKLKVRRTRLAELEPDKTD